MEKNGSKETCQIRDRHLLVALDRSDDAKRVSLYVADFLGGVPGFLVTLLTIIPEPSVDYFQNQEEREVWIKEQRSGAEKMLRNYREMLIQSGFRKDKVLVRVDARDCHSISECILENQKKLGCCTVVLGRRGISKQEELLHGSTSSKVMHCGQNCAVWVVE